MIQLLNMKKAVVVTAAIIVLSFTHFAALIAGGALFAQPTDSELRQDAVDTAAAGDLRILMENYGTMWGLCEEKFTAVTINDDVTTAIRLNGQIDVLKVQNEGIKAKWNNSTTIY